MMLQQNRAKSTIEKTTCTTIKNLSHIFDLVAPTADYRMKVEELCLCVPC